MSRAWIRRDGRGARRKNEPKRAMRWVLSFPRAAGKRWDGSSERIDGRIAGAGPRHRDKGRKHGRYSALTRRSWAVFWCKNAFEHILRAHFSGIRPQRRRWYRRTFRIAYFLSVTVFFLLIFFYLFFLYHYSYRFGFRTAVFRTAVFRTAVFRTAEKYYFLHFRFSHFFQIRQTIFFQRQSM